MATDLDVACDLLEEHGFDDEAAFLRTGVAAEDYEAEADKCAELEKRVDELEAELNAVRDALYASEAVSATMDKLDSLAEGTRTWDYWPYPSTLQRLTDVVDEWRERGERIEELEAELSADDG